MSTEKFAGHANGIRTLHRQIMNGSSARVQEIELARVGIMIGAVGNVAGTAAVGVKLAGI